MSSKSIFLSLAALLAVAVLAPNVGAFHGAWWKGFGTATDTDAKVYDLEFYWGGQKAIINCDGGQGCQGAGDGRLTLRDELGLATTYPYVGVEDVRNILLTNESPFCPSQLQPFFWENPLEITPNYLLEFSGGQVSGIQRNCLSTGINKSDFTGQFNGFALVIHSEGTFGATHG